MPRGIPNTNKRQKISNKKILSMEATFPSHIKQTEFEKNVH
jgi:hypothetical protein